MSRVTADAYSRFSNGTYNGYEVRLYVRRSHSYRPHTVRNSYDIYSLMRDVSRYSEEHIYSLLMDSLQQVTGVHLVGKGSCEYCLVPPADVFKAAISTNSPMFAVVHNHPCGNPEPSEMDMTFTSRVRRGSRLLGLELFDSLIIGDRNWYSFRERGRLGPR